MNETMESCGTSSDATLNTLIVAGQVMERRLEEAVQPYGLSLAKLFLLHTLVQQEEPVPLGNLSRELHCVKSNITQLIDRLEADKLVRRVPDPEDRRSVRAELTEEGRKRYAEGWQAVESAKIRALENLSDKERDQLARLLGLVIEGGGD